jgi:hypothetical protein
VVFGATVDENHDYPILTVDEIIHLLAHFTPEQRSLAWSPQPPFESMGASDCRAGGNCGLDFNHETARARWIQARHRYQQEEKKHEKESQKGTRKCPRKTGAQIQKKREQK